MFVDGSSTVVIEIEQIAESGELVAFDAAHKPSVGERWNAFESRLEQVILGRAVLSFMRWGVVLVLIASGFFGASAVSSGVKLAGGGNSSSHQILATSSAK
jgi:hypothetical protein